MSANLNTTVTKLVVKALDAAGVTDRAWRSHFKINAQRLTRIRGGRVSLTDEELTRISRVTGEPWQNLVLGVLGSDSKLTADTQELLSSLQSLKRSAAAEAVGNSKGRQEFRSLRQLVRRESAYSD